MSRPTREQVDGMLGIDVYDCDGSTAKDIAWNLQAEVRALRESNERLQAANDILDDTVGELTTENKKLREELEDRDNLEVEVDALTTKNAKLREERDRFEVAAEQSGRTVIIRDRELLELRAHRDQLLAVISEKNTTIASVEALLGGYEAHVAEYPDGARSAAIAVYQTVIIELKAALKG